MGSFGGYGPTQALPQGQGVMSYFQDPDVFQGILTVNQTSGSSIMVQPFMLPMPVSMSYIRFLASYNDSAVGTAGTTSANTTFTCAAYTTVGIVMYTAGVGANSRSLQSIGSTSIGITGLTQYSAGAIGSQYTMTVIKTYPDIGGTASYSTSYAVSSGSIVISSNSNTLFTGPRFLDVAWATSFSQGNYWMGFGASVSTASQTSNISFCGTALMPMSLYACSQSNLSVGRLGVATSASDNQLMLGNGVFTTNSSAFTTASIGIAQVSQVASNPGLFFQFIRQA